MEIPVKTEAFSGPLDLLLHLIEKNKVNIYDIPIAEITDQYMAYLSNMSIPDLDNESEFLVMASTLVNIKSRMLLPAEKDENGEEIDPRSELVERLLLYKMVKYSAELLAEREDENGVGQYIFKEPEIPPEVAKFEVKPDISELTKGLTLSKLHEIYDFLVKRQNDKIDPVRSTFGEIRREPVSLANALKSLTDYMKDHDSFDFTDYLMKQPDRLHIVVNFLAVLHLMKMGAVEAVQDGPHDDISVRFVKDPEFTDEDIAQMGDM